MLPGLLDSLGNGVVCIVVFGYKLGCALCTLWLCTTLHYGFVLCFDRCYSVYIVGLYIVLHETCSCPDGLYTVGPKCMNIVDVYRVYVVHFHCVLYCMLWIYIVLCTNTVYVFNVLCIVVYKFKIYSANVLCGAFFIVYGYYVVNYTWWVCNVLYIIHFGNLT